MNEQAVVEVAIVTPTFNSERFLENTIMSVAHQEAPTNRRLLIRYHVQDGGSTDGTLKIAAEWQQRLVQPHNHGRTRVILSVTSSPDRGMYDAINKGFAQLPLEHCLLMTWINSDDILAPGAVAAAVDIVNAFPATDWLGGRPATIGEFGAIIKVGNNELYNRTALEAGRHDGRERRFLMQEGVFWRPALWRAVEGLNPDFRLAGDWDLWRRFAKHTPYCSVDTIFGFHRKRSGQLSEDLATYHREIDQARPSRDPSKHGEEIVHIWYDYIQRHWVMNDQLNNAQARNSISRIRDIISDWNRRRLKRRRARKMKNRFSLGSGRASQPEDLRWRVPYKTDSMAKLVQLGLPVGTILDVGVHKGTRELIEVFPEKPHLLFEPIVEFNPQISEAYANTKHEVFNVAISDSDGDVFMTTESVILGSDITHSQIADVAGGSRTGRTVSCSRLDTLMAKRNSAEPYLMKIDVDGAEMKVLTGAEVTLGKTSVVIIEATLPTLPERLSFLYQHGFELFDIVDLCYYGGVLYQVDLVLVRRDLLAGLAIPSIRPFEPSSWYSYRHD